MKRTVLFLVISSCACAHAFKIDVRQHGDKEMAARNAEGVERLNLDNFHFTPVTGVNELLVTTNVARLLKTP